jgi:hypothetical protein
MTEKEVQLRLDRWLAHLEMLEATDLLTPAQKEKIADGIVEWAEHEFRRLDNAARQ